MPLADIEWVLSLAVHPGPEAVRYLWLDRAGRP
jgi:hypothetical protein